MSTGLPEYAGFAANLAEGRLAFPRCRDCGRFHWYPKPVCPHCRSTAIEWRPVRGRGVVYSFTTVHHAFDEKWRGSLPYVVALVTFEDAPGVRLITNLTGVAPKDVRIGAAVEPVIPADGGHDRVVFRLAS